MSDQALETAARIGKTDVTHAQTIVALEPGVAKLAPILARYPSDLLIAPSDDIMLPENI